MIAPNTVLKAEGISSGYVHRGQRIPVLRGIDCDILAGVTMAILGPSGVGKSTLLNVLAALLSPDEGLIRFVGPDGLPTLLPRQECPLLRWYRNVYVQLVHQSPVASLVSHFTAERNVALPLLIQGISWPVARRRARELLSIVGLAKLAARCPPQLSGGECQRAAIARAIAVRPAVVLADEPTGSLDLASAKQAMDALAELVHGEGLALVLVTHDRRLAHRYADVVLELGPQTGLRRAAARVGR
jgi:ABC-type lipoprotein export system ATPase subunit